MILIDRLHKYFEREFDLSELDSIKLKYSLGVVIGELSKFSILLILFLVLDKATDFIYCFSVLLVTRTFTGGLHFKTYSGCLTFSGIFFYVTVFLKSNIELDIGIISILFIFSLLITLIFAPIYGNSRPNYSKKVSPI